MVLKLYDLWNQPPKEYIIFIEAGLPIEMKQEFLHATNGGRGKLLFLVRSEQLLERLMDPFITSSNVCRYQVHQHRQDAF